MKLFCAFCLIPGEETVFLGAYSSQKLAQKRLAEEKSAKDKFYQKYFQFYFLITNLDKSPDTDELGQLILLG